MTNENHLSNIAEIRSIMERTTSFISLSGLSGVVSGIFAIIGAFIAFWLLDFKLSTENFSHLIFLPDGTYNFHLLFLLFIDVLGILVFATFFGILLSVKKAKKNNQKFWDTTTKRLIVNLLIPLIIGGIFGLILLYHKQVYLISSITLIFYGLALINASKFTLRDIKFLGISEAILGLFASFFIGYGLIFWTIGFGLLHIFYGVIMYLKYDR